MTILRVIVEPMLDPTPGGISRYTEELTRELIRSAPSGCSVEGVIAASTEAAYSSVRERLPGLAGLHKSTLARRELTAAWQHGFTRLPGMIHSPSLLAPLARHDRLNNGDQIAVTVHDVVAWTHPESIGSRAAAWHKAMAKRAQKYADAIVVPTHAVGDQLADIGDFGDRIRVIGGAVSSKLTRPVDADARAERLGLPERYLLAVDGLEAHRGIGELIRALAQPGAAELPLLIVGPADGDEALAAIIAEVALPDGHVRGLGNLADADLAVVIERATVFVVPSLEEGFGIRMIEAFHFGTPVVHSDAAALIEVAGDAGVVVARADADGYPERLARAISQVVEDSALAERLGISGQDRAKAFSWRNSAEKVWQLHADL